MNIVNKLITCVYAQELKDVPQLALRIALGAIFAWHGWDKVATKGVEGVAGFLGSLGFPLPMLFSYILSYGELIAGVMLIVGAFTHLAAKYATIVAIVALVLVHAKNGFNVATGGYEFILLILAASISLEVTGAGKYSLDATTLKSWYQ